MNNLPFSLSVEAAKWISKKLEAEANDPASSGMIPTLVYNYDYQSRDMNNRLFEWCRCPFFDIGWDTPESAHAQKYVKLQIGDCTIFAPIDTMERLTGKELVVETVEVGYPTPSDKSVKLLRLRGAKSHSAQ